MYIIVETNCEILEKNMHFFFFKKKTDPKLLKSCAQKYD